MSLITQLGYAHENPTPLQRLVLTLVATRTGAWLAARALPSVDRSVLRATGGRATVTSILGGLPAIVLTTRGARTGLDRSVLLVAIPLGEDLAVIGSNFGQSTAPAWAHNLVANPSAHVAYRHRSVAVTARLAGTAECEAAFRGGAMIYPGYTKYRDRVTTRSIMVFVLSSDA